MRAKMVRVRARARAGKAGSTVLVVASLDGRERQKRGGVGRVGVIARDKGSRSV